MHMVRLIIVNRPTMTSEGLFEAAIFAITSEATITHGGANVLDSRTNFLITRLAQGA